MGMRWAKLQQNIVLAYAIGMFKWIPCDANGNPVPPSDPRTNLEEPSADVPQGVYCKYVLREEM
jgi:hypothetical protein